MLLRQRFPQHFILEKAIYQKTKTWGDRLHEYFYFRNTFTLTAFHLKKNNPKCVTAWKPRNYRLLSIITAKIWLCKQILIAFSWCANAQRESLCQDEQVKWKELCYKWIYVGTLHKKKQALQHTGTELQDLFSNYNLLGIILVLFSYRLDWCD